MHRTLGVAVAVAAVLAGAAAAAPSRDQVIRPGVGIAKARIGMTAQQIRKAMGVPQAVIVTPQAFGRRHLEWQYGFGSYIVRMQGVKGRERVMSVTTVLRKEKTPQGIGVGSLEAELLRRQPGVRCAAHEPDTTFAEGHTYMGGRRECTLRSAGGAQTLFVIDGPTVLMDGLTVAEFEARWRREAAVMLVSVRAEGYRPPERRLSSRSADELLRPGVGIAKIRLGMTAAQVRKAQGRPQAVIEKPQGFGRRTLEFQYGFASLVAELRGPRGRERVVFVQTHLEREKTATGVGPGAPETKLLSVYPAVRCPEFEVYAQGSYDRIGGGRRCTLDGPSGARTIFGVRGPWMRLSGPGDTVTRREFEARWASEAEIEWVVVRAAGVTHPTERES